MLDLTSLAAIATAYFYHYGFARSGHAVSCSHINERRAAERIDVQFRPVDCLKLLGPRRSNGRGCDFAELAHGFDDA